MGLSQQELARLLEVSKHRVTAWERDRSQPTETEWLVLEKK
jgi:DNA-binding transcriptional regulator YiaG